MYVDCLIVADPLSSHSHRDRNCDRIILHHRSGTNLKGNHLYSIQVKQFINSLLEYKYLKCFIRKIIIPHTSFESFTVKVNPYCIAKLFRSNCITHYFDPF